MNRLMKSRENKIIDGVLGGIGESLRIDPVIVRVVFIIFAFAVDFGTALILYIAGVIIFPTSNSSFDHSKSNKPAAMQNGHMLIGIAFILIGVVFLFDNLFHLNLNWLFRELGGYLWSILLVILGLFLIFRRR